MFLLSIFLSDPCIPLFATPSTIRPRGNSPLESRCTRGEEVGKVEVQEPDETRFQEPAEDHKTAIPGDDPLERPQHVVAVVTI